MRVSQHHLDEWRNSPFARPDFERENRKGVPEVILASTKSVEQSLSIAQSLLARTGRAILSRVSPELEAALRDVFGTEGFEWYPAPRMAIIRRDGIKPKPNGGRVGIITAGTSDQAMGEEAAIICQEMGCLVDVVYDVGVAGLHRLFGPLQHLLKEVCVDVIIVAAGMDGALPSVVSGLVDVPVIGLPTSVGYGMGGKGEAALLSMLQTCAPGLAVVNIDNGVGAGAIAGLIAKRAGMAREQANERSEVQARV